MEQTNRPSCCRNAVCSEASRSGGVSDGNGGGNERLQRPFFITQSYLVILHLLKRTQLRPDGPVSLSRGSDNAAYLSLGQEQCEDSQKSASTCEAGFLFFFQSISFPSLWCVMCLKVTLVLLTLTSKGIPKWLSCRFESTLVPVMQRNRSGTQEKGSFQSDFGAKMGAVTTTSKPLCTLWLSNCSLAAFFQVRTPWCYCWRPKRP